MLGLASHMVIRPKLAVQRRNRVCIHLHLISHIEELTNISQIVF